jgi:hypothetical protein
MQSTGSHLEPGTPWYLKENGEKTPQEILVTHLLCSACYPHFGYIMSSVDGLCERMSHR